MPPTCVRLSQSLPESADGVVGHHSHRAPRLDPLDPSGKRAEARAKRLEVARSKLAAGKRRACCFDRSGMYSKSMSCPVADGESNDTSAKVEGNWTGRQLKGVLNHRTAV